jgi:hypothetical protein
MEITRTASEVAKTEAEEASYRAVSSLCGLILRRLQDDDDEAIPKGGPVTFEDLSRIFGEALEQFSLQRGEYK